MKKYIITLNEHQLRLISQCVEDCCRFMSGQTDSMSCIHNLDNYLEVRDAMDKLHSLVTPMLGHNASYGWNGGNCQNENQRKFLAETYYIYREILHRIMVSNGIDNVYSSPTLRCNESGEPIIIEEVL